MKLVLICGIITYAILTKLSVFIVPKLVISYGVCIMTWLLINEKNI